jgi:phospholipid-binding lipoprotein MlaA
MSPKFPSITVQPRLGGRFLLVARALVLALLGGCASGPTANPQDPLEPLNRTVFKFNDAVDRAVLKPVATAYRDVTPPMVRKGVYNFFANLEDAWSFVNNLLQFKAEAAVSSFMRFNINTFFGLAGVLDFASEMGLERFPEDFGQTLGHWGLGAGPYVVLPLLGPSTVRDTVALPVDYQGDIVTHVTDVPTRNSLAGLRVVDTRAKYLNAGNVMEEAALDKYSFARDAYIQRRRNAVYDGNPPDDLVDQ